MDSLIIKNAEFLCNVGCSAEERGKKQKIYASIKLFSGFGKAGKSDNLEDAVDYLEVHRLIKKLAEGKEYKLIEAIAENIAATIMQEFNVEKVLVRVAKPNALADKNVKNVAVEIIREKAD